MDNTVIVKGPEQAIRAGTWAEKFVKGNWKMALDQSPFSNYYHFNFDNSQDATHFALKWAQ